MLRVSAYLAMIIGLVIGAIGVLSATLWKPPSVVEATTVEMTTPAVVLPLEVRDLLDTSVKITFTATDDKEIVVAGAPLPDVQAWLGENSYTKVTGIKSWKELKTTVSGKGDLPAIADSDVWVGTLTGKGMLTLQGGQLALFKNSAILAMTDGKSPAPKLTITWPREVSTPYLFPALALGLILVVGGLVVLYEARRRRKAMKRREARRARRRERLAELETETLVLTKVLDSDLESAETADTTDVQDVESGTAVISSPENQEN